MSLKGINIVKPDNQLSTVLHYAVSLHISIATIFLNYLVKIGWSKLKKFTVKDLNLKLRLIRVKFSRWLRTIFLFGLIYITNLDYCLQCSSLVFSSIFPLHESYLLLVELTLKMFLVTFFLIFFF